MFSPVNDLLRNPFRILNHRELIEKKIRIAHYWSLVWNVEAEDSLVRKNKAMLTALFNREIEINEAIDGIQSQNPNPDRRDFRKDLADCYATGLLEFHPTDRCDLDCIDCHYRSKGRGFIRFSEIENLIKPLTPKAVTLTGGGEPNVYKSQSKTMNDLVLLIKDMFKDTGIGIINNNTFLPTGEWINHVLWHRSSIDAATEETYSFIKKRNRLGKVLANVLTLLYDSPIPFVGVGFLYRKENIHEVFDFLNYWFDWYANQKDAVQKRFNIQFRPISPAIKDVIAIRRGEKVFVEKETIKRLAHEVMRVKGKASSDAMFHDFLNIRTNFGALPDLQREDDSCFLHAPLPFNNCYNALAHRVLRANGDEYPDFLLCDDPRLKLGNRLESRTEVELLRISLMQFYYFNRGSQYCNAEACRQGWISYTFEKHSFGCIGNEATRLINKFY